METPKEVVGVSSRRIRVRHDACCAASSPQGAECTRPSRTAIWRKPLAISQVTRPDAGLYGPDVNRVESANPSYQGRPQQSVC